MSYRSAAPDPMTYGSGPKMPPVFFGVVIQEALRCKGRQEAVGSGSHQLVPLPVAGTGTATPTREGQRRSTWSPFYEWTTNPIVPANVFVGRRLCIEVS